MLLHRIGPSWSGFRRCSLRSYAVLISALWALTGGAGLCVQAGPIDEIVDQVDETMYRHYLDDLLFAHDGDSRAFQRSYNERIPARKNIQETFASVGVDCALHGFWRPEYHGYNVVARLWGVSEPNEVIVLGAHLDSKIGPGADDDASGVAGMLEAARILSRYRFERSIFFIAFDSEEARLRGSFHYTRDFMDKYSYQGMIQLDMIAFNPDGLDAIDISYSTDPTPLLEDVHHAIAEWSDLESQIVRESAGSDHRSFERIGVPACLLIERAENPYIHSKDDTLDRPGYIDYAFATDVTRAVVGYLASSAGLIGPRDYVLHEPVPGLAGELNEFILVGATPGMRSFFVYGRDLGEHEIPGCPSAVLDMQNPRIFGASIADENGEIRFSQFVPEAARGIQVLIQAAEPDSCDASDSLRFTFD